MSGGSQPIDQPRYRSILPNHSAYDLHAVALIELAGDRVVLAHTQVEIAARWLHNLVHKLLEDFPPRAVELPGVQDLVQHDTASWNLHLAHAGPLLVLLERNRDAVFVDALPRLDAALERVLPNMREHIPVGLKVSVNRLEIAQTRVSHGYRFVKTKIGSVLKALFPMCFSPTILLS